MSEAGDHQPAPRLPADVLEGDRAQGLACATHHTQHTGPTTLFHLLETLQVCVLQIILNVYVHV